MTSSRQPYFECLIGVLLVVLCVYCAVKFGLWHENEETEYYSIPQMKIEYKIRQINEDLPSEEYVIREYEIGGDWPEDSNPTIQDSEWPEESNPTIQDSEWPKESNPTIQDSEWTFLEEGNLTFIEKSFNNSDMVNNYWEKHLKKAFDFSMHFAKYLNSTIKDRNLTFAEFGNLTLSEEYFDDLDVNSTESEKSFLKNVFKVKGHFANIFNLTLKDENLTIPEESNVTIPEDYFDYPEVNHEDLDIKKANERRQFLAKFFNFTIQDGDLRDPEEGNLVPEFKRKLKRRKRKVVNLKTRVPKRGLRSKVRHAVH